VAVAKIMLEHYGDVFIESFNEMLECSVSNQRVNIR